MTNPTEAIDVWPRVRAEVLHPRLDALRLALGGVACSLVRRLPGADRRDNTFEVLASVGVDGPIIPAERGVPPAFVHELVGEARSQEWTLGQGGDAQQRLLRREGIGWLAGWVFPEDRWPCVFFIVQRRGQEDPGPRRRIVARAGMVALARLVAPPAWLFPARVPAPTPLRRRAQEDSSRTPRPRPAEESLKAVLDEVERSLIVSALHAAEGNKTRAAQRLCVSRQGLYRKLARHGLLDRTEGVDTAGTDD